MHDGGTEPLGFVSAAYHSHAPLPCFPQIRNRDNRRTFSIKCFEIWHSNLADIIRVTHLKSGPVR